MFNTWSTIEDDKIVNFENIKEPIYNSELEKYTDYKFTPGQKFNTITSEVIEQTKSDILGVNEGLNNIGNSILNTTKLLKYIPFLLVGASVYFVYKRANYGK